MFFLFKVKSLIILNSIIKIKKYHNIIIIFFSMAMFGILEFLSIGIIPKSNSTPTLMEINNRILKCEKL